MSQEIQKDTPWGLLVRVLGSSSMFMIALALLPTLVVAPPPDGPGGADPDIPLGTGHPSKAAFRVAVALAYLGLMHLITGSGPQQGRLVQRGHGSASQERRSSRDKLLSG